MTAGAVGSKGYTTGGNVIDAMRTGIRRMTGLAVCAAAGTRCRAVELRAVDQILNAADGNPNKIDLGIGVYKDEEGNTPSSWGSAPSR